MFWDIVVFTVIAVVAVAAAFGLALWLSPEGYEDETGFHYGRKEEEK